VICKLHLIGGSHLYKNFWLDNKKKKEKELKKTIDHLNKLLMEFNYEDYIFIISERSQSLKGTGFSGG